MAPPDLRDLVRTALAGTPLKLAILFGSAAAGRLRADSDVDVAIVPRDPEWSTARELDLQTLLERACGRSVHVVRLDRASLLLRWQVARHGVLLAADEPAAYPRFVAATASEYLDAAPALLAAARTYARRLGSGR